MPDSLTSLLSVAFDAGQLTSDGSLIWLGQADDQLGLSAAFATQLRDWRRGPVRHPLALLVRQRILQIACGYEDQDDADNSAASWRKCIPSAQDFVAASVPPTAREWLSGQPTSRHS